MCCFATDRSGVMASTDGAAKLDHFHNHGYRAIAYAFPGRSLADNKDAHYALRRRL